MGLFEQFPYTNFQEKNLDRIAGATGDIDRKVAAASDSASGAAASREAAATSAEASAGSAAAASRSATDAASSAQHAEDTVASVFSVEADLNIRMDALDTRMDSFEQLTPGSTTGDAELQDIRITWDGKTKATAGAAVRDQARDAIENQIKNGSYDILPIFNPHTNSTISGVTFTWSGEILNINGTATNNAINLIFNGTNGFPAGIQKGHKYLIKTDMYDAEKHAAVSIVVVRPGGNNYYYAYYPQHNMTFTVPEDSTGVSVRVYVVGGYTYNNLKIHFGIYPEYNNSELYAMAADTDRVFEQYAQFDDIKPGHWGTTGTVAAGLWHTEMLSVRPSTEYYASDDLGENEDITTFGVEFDAAGKWLRPIMRTELEEISYQTADGTGTYTDYAHIWKFTTSADCHYISINTRLIYRGGIASKPIYLVHTTPNIVIHRNDPAWVKHKDNVLCCIGTSAVMIDRLGRVGQHTPPYQDTTNQFICGFQEYLWPWYKEVVSYGYSNGTFVNSEDPAENNIYKRIVTDQMDLSGYDEFFINNSSIGVTSANVGTLTGPDDLGDPYTYMGSIRRMIAYIYSQNSKAQIYMLTRFNRPAFSSQSYYNNQVMVNNATLRIGELTGIKVIDAARSSGYNQYNTADWCYDTLGHYTQYGNKMLGEFIRKEIIGC